MRVLRVALVGIGAVGSEAAQQLGRLRIGKVLLIDADRVEESNLSRGTLYRGHVGEWKAPALAEECGRWFPETQWKAVPSEIADVGWGRLQDCDLLLSAVDRDSARLEIARIATRLRLPVCEAGLSTSNLGRGRVTWYPARAGAACFGCRLTAQRRREMLTSWRSSVHPCIGPAAESGGWNSTPAMASIIGALLVDTAMRPGEKADCFTQELEIAPEFSARRVVHPRSEQCPFHAAARALTPAKNGPVSSFLEERMALEWEWTICVAASCLECGHVWSPRQRLARLLRDARCPNCGGARVRADESLRRITADSPWAKLAPGEIGLPADHLYTMVTSSTSPEAPPVEASE
jgi:adenylyltransferase/sulfurtransferase